MTQADFVQFLGEHGLTAVMVREPLKRCGSSMG